MVIWNPKAPAVYFDLRLAVLISLHERALSWHSECISSGSKHAQRDAAARHGLLLKPGRRHSHLTLTQQPSTLTRAVAALRMHQQWQ